MPKKRSGKRGIDGQLVGAGLLSIAAIASLSTLVFFLMRGPGSGQSDLTIEDGDSPIIGNLPAPGAGPQVLSGKGLQIQITDKDDPTRLVAEMNFGKLDPMPNRRYEASRMRTWIYMQSGEFVLITAPRAVLTMPDGKRPESGSLTGGVQMFVYDPPKGGGRPDISFAEPRLVANTDRFDFNLTIGEVSSPGRLTVHTEQVDFAGIGMKAMFNESRQRIEYVEVREGESLVYRPKTLEQEDPPVEIARSPGGNPNRPNRQNARANNLRPEADPINPTESASADPQMPGAKPEAERKAPVRRHYHVLFQDAVRVVQGVKEIRGDRLDVFARLVDNKLPHDALGREQASIPLPAAQSAGSSLRNVLTSAAIAAMTRQPEPLSAIGDLIQQDSVQDPQDQPDEQVALDLLAQDETVVLNWDGPMIVDFLEDGAPAELKEQNHLAVRFSAPESGSVAFEDHQSGSTGFCGELLYKATHRELALGGLGPHSVRLMQPGAGMLEAGRVEFNLYTGEASIPGAGIAHALRDEQVRPDPASPRRVSWTERADMQLALREEKITGDLVWAKMIGRVEALDGEARLGGEVMDATFFERTEDRKPNLRHLEVVGPVTGGDGRGATILGERLAVDFAASDAGRSDPRTVSIEGRAEVRRDASTLLAGIVDARLRRNEEDKLVIAFVSARDDVQYTDTENLILATCDRLRADASLKIADLEGETVVLRQGNDEIGGSQVHLNGTDRIVEVFGAGTFTRHRDSESGPAIATANWTKQMLFDDRQGTLDCFGNAFATWRPQELAIDEVTAERVHIELTPYREQSEGTTDALGVRVDRDKREVLRVRAIGAAQLEEGGAPAVIQSLRESPIEPAEGEERAIDTLLRLEGPEIFANNELGRLRVDHPGRLVVADYREAEQAESVDADVDAVDPLVDENIDEVELAAEEPIQIDDPGSMRGSALFEWDDSLVVDRNLSTITMDGRVRMTHVRLGDQLATRLLCQHLVAGFEQLEEEPDVGSGAELGAGRLRSVLASGEVYARSGRQELMGDELLYDARLSTVEAQAAEGGRVTYVDARTGTPSSARRIFWDLKSDRIEIRQPGTLVLPR